MGAALRHVVRAAMREADSWDTHQWMIAFAIVVGLGFMLLRGFGSRTNY